MLFIRSNMSKRALVAVCSLGLLSSCIHKKYENPITKNTQQPDKVLFDQAMRDIEKGHYEVARLSLNTLMNTYESSEYLAKAKLAIADSWYREGTATGMAQAESEYKDFELFYPNMEEAAEAQSRVCDIHYKQMDKSDRDITQTLRAEDECRTLIQQYPNSKFAPQAMQRLRNIQESLAEHEFVVGNFYWKREMNPAAANRLNALVDQYPLYSKADEALYEAGDSYSRMGPRYRKQAGEMFARIIHEYPLGDRTDDAKKRLEELEMPIPQPDPAAVARMNYERENYVRPGLYARVTGFMHGGPDVSHAAKEGAPTMTDPKKTIPVSVPVPVDTEAATASGTPGTANTEVTASTVTSSNSALETKPDARTTAGATTDTAKPAAAQAPLPSNRDKELALMRKQQAKKMAQLQKKNKKKQKKNSEQDQQQGAQPPAGATTAATSTTASTTTGTAATNQ